MKTTEIFVEQVIIGFLVLVVIVLIGIDHPWKAWQDAGLDASATAALGVALVGAAYLLGILYDRFADTLLEDFDRHNRLAVALDGADPEFPESKMRLAALREGGGVVEHADYLRSRLRLARAMATLAPALTLAWITHQLARDSAMWKFTVVWLTSVYAAAYFWKLAGGPDRAPSPEDSDQIETYRRRFHAKAKLRVWRMLVGDGAFWAAVAIFVWAVQLGSQYWPATAAGALVTSVAGSVWWRISITHRKFIRRVWKSARPPATE